MHFRHTRPRELGVCFRSGFLRHFLLEGRVFQNSDDSLGESSRVPRLHYESIFSLINYFGYTADIGDDHRLPKGKGQGDHAALGGIDIGKNDDADLLKKLCDGLIRNELINDLVLVRVNDVSLVFVKILSLSCDGDLEVFEGVGRQVRPPSNI